MISIYAIRWGLLRLFIGKDILPQLFIAPRGLITVLLFYAIPKEAQVSTFEPGVLLFVIIGTSLVMTWAMIRNKQKMDTPIDIIDEEIDAWHEGYMEEKAEQSALDILPRPEERKLPRTDSSPPGDKETPSDSDGIPGSDDHYH